MSDFYQMLGVPRDVTSAQLRAAYAREAKRNHPDLAPGRALPNRLSALQQAFRTLNHPEMRAAYDVDLVQREQMLVAARLRVERRLRKYDRRRAARRVGKAAWRPLVLLACVAAAALHFSIG